jgi:tetratricopeptide (TPR) repeat protein
MSMFFDTGRTGNLGFSIFIFCLLGLLAWPLQASAQPGHASAGGAAAAATRARLVSLRSAVKSKQLGFKLKGDGQTTSKVELVLTNKTNQELRVVIPANEVFKPNTLLVQTMMVTRDRVVTVPAGGTVSTDLPTMCVSTKTVRPPPAEGIEFEVGAYPDADVWKDLASIVEAGKQLNKTGAYDRTMFARERRESTISQLAVWTLLGRKSSNADDQVTPKAIADDTLDKMGIKREQLSKEKQEMFEKGIDQIFLAVDLTIKKAKEPAVQSLASLPSDSTFDTFVQVGARAVQKGDFTEAEELLTAAVDEATKYGENDPRLATCLLRLGDCYLFQGKADKAEPFYYRSLLIRQKALGPEFAETAESLDGLGLACKLSGKNKEAEGYLVKALSIREKSLGPDHTLVAETAGHLASVYTATDKHAEAEQLYKRALAINYKNLGPESAEVAETDKHLADLYMRDGKAAQADKLYKRALTIGEKALGKDHPYMCAIMDGLAESSRASGREADADEMAKNAQAVREKLLGSNASLIACVPDDHLFHERLAAYSSEFEKMETSVKELQGSPLVVAAGKSSKLDVNKPVKDKWALIIGVSKFKDPAITLKFAAKDASDFHDYLVKEANFNPDHVHLLLNEQATRENILAEVGDRWLPRVAGPDDLVIVYISSHGSPSKVDIRGTNYLVAYDTDKNSLYATGVPMQDLSKIVKERVHADRVVLVLDACHSGAATPAAKGLYRQANFDVDQIVQGSGQLVICSSEPSQTSWESAKYDNGVFTHYLIEGLRKQGSKTPLGQAFNFMKDEVQKEVLRDRGELQTPVLKSRWEGSELLLAAPPAEPRPGRLSE